MSRAALEQLYERLEKPLFNVLYRWVFNSDEAHDLVQETFLRLWRKRQEVRMETVEPLTFRIATNLAANRRRANKLWRWVTLEAVQGFSTRSTDAEAALARREDRHLVQRAIAALPEKLRRVIVLCELSGMSYKQVAETLRIPIGTVGSRRNAALKRLREQLGPGLED